MADVSWESPRPPEVRNNEFFNFVDLFKDTDTKKGDRTNNGGVGAEPKKVENEGGAGSDTKKVENEGGAGSDTKTEKNDGGAGDEIEKEGGGGDDGKPGSDHVHCAHKEGDDNDGEPEKDDNSL